MHKNKKVNDYALPCSKYCVKRKESCTCVCHMSMLERKEWHECLFTSADETCMNDYFV